jgi:hypothetical protein
VHACIRPVIYALGAYDSPGGSVEHHERKWGSQAVRPISQHCLNEVTAQVSSTVHPDGSTLDIAYVLQACGVFAGHGRNTARAAYELEAANC